MSFVCLFYLSCTSRIHREVKGSRDWRSLLVLGLGEEFVHLYLFYFSCQGERLEGHAQITILHH